MDTSKEQFPPFYGRKDGKEDPYEFVENVEFVVEERDYTEIRKATALRFTFRLHLREKAYEWYQKVIPDRKNNWKYLKADFLTEFRIMVVTTGDFNKYFSLVYNLKQRRSTIAQYVAEAEGLYEKCPADLRTYLGNQFIAGLADENKIDMVQVYLAEKTTITFPEVKEAVIKAYSRIGRASPFDIMEDSKPTTVNTQTEVNREIMIFFKELRVQSQNFHARSETGPAYTKPLPIEGAKPYSNLRGDFYCHNCTQPDHMSDSCPEPKVTYKQRMDNRRKIDELLTENTDGAASAASAQPSAENPLGVISGNADRVMNS
jgi:hypothetical protein